MLASVSDDASLVLWDTNARRSVHQFTRSHKAPATDLAFSPANDRLVMSCGIARERFAAASVRHAIELIDAAEFAQAHKVLDQVLSPDVHPRYLPALTVKNAP